MPSRASKKGGKRADAAQTALRVVEEAIGGPLVPPIISKKNPHAVALSKLGAKKGGQARAAKLTDERRAEIARKAAEARWKKPKTL
jgi:hypothetical protein